MHVQGEHFRQIDAHVVYTYRNQNGLFEGEQGSFMEGASTIPGLAVGCRYVRDA